MIRLLLATAALLLPFPAAAQAPTNPQPHSILEWGPKCDGIHDDSGVVATAAAALRDTGSVIYVPSGCKLRLDPTADLTTIPPSAQVWLRGVAIVGDGLRNFDGPSGQQGAQIYLTNTVVSPFVVSDNWALRGLTFYWPNQPLISGTSAVPYPALIIPHSSNPDPTVPADTTIGWDFTNNQVINAYDLVDLTTTLNAGHFHVEKNSIYTLRYGFVLKSVGGESWFDHNQFSPVAWQEVINAGNVTNPTLLYTLTHSEAIRIVGDGGTPHGPHNDTHSQWNVAGLEASANYFLGYNSALHVSGGTSTLMTWTSNGLDGLPNPILVDNYGNVEMAITGGEILQSYAFNPTYNSGCAVNIAAGAEPDNGLSLANVDFNGAAASAVCMTDIGNSRLSINGGSMWNVGQFGNLNSVTTTTPAVVFNGPNGSVAVTGVAMRNTYTTNVGPAVAILSALAATVSGNTFDSWMYDINSLVPAAFTGNAIARTPAGGAVAIGQAVPSGNVADIAIPQQLVPACSGAATGQACTNGGSGSAVVVK